MTLPEWGYTVTLSKSEQEIARLLGRQRQAHNMTHSVQDFVVGDRQKADPEMAHVNAAGAEMAFCKLFNLYPEFTVGSFSDYDCKSYMGRTINVKNRRTQGYDLIANVKQANKHKVCDYYALMIGELPTYKYVGMAKGEDLINEKTLKDYGHGPTYSIPQTDLIHIEPLGDKPV